MISRRKLFLLLIVLSLAAGCTAAHTPTPTPTILPSPTELPTDTPTPVPPTPTDTPLPTATATATLPPPTSTPTEVPPTATNTPKPTLPPTQPPAATAAPAAAKATAPASMPGVDVVAVRGQETCVNKFVNVSYEWQGEQDPKGRKMFYWDEKWSVYPMYARPNIKFATVISSCGKDNQCNGFSADFCVYVDGGAPPGGTYETEVILIIASGYPPAAPGRPITDPKLLATTTAKFSWYIR